MSQIEFSKDQSIQVAVSSLSEYWGSYGNQSIQDYSVGILLEDALYGIGIAIDPEKYKEAAGFARFKTDLIERLKLAEGSVTDSDKYPRVTGQQLIDAGINSFAVKLLGDSLKESNISEPVSFRYKGIGITIKPLTKPEEQR